MTIPNPSFALTLLKASWAVGGGVAEAIMARLFPSFQSPRGKKPNVMLGLTTATDGFGLSILLSQCRRPPETGSSSVPGAVAGEDTAADSTVVSHHCGKPEHVHTNPNVRALTGVCGAAMGLCLGRALAVASELLKRSSSHKTKKGPVGEEGR